MAEYEHARAGRKDGVGDVVRSIAASGPRIDEGNVAGEVPDKTLRHQERRLDPRSRTMISPIVRREDRR